MKNKILALLATIGLASSVTAVDVNENLKIQGFLDFSYVNSELSLQVPELTESQRNGVG